MSGTDDGSSGPTVVQANWLKDVNRNLIITLLAVTVPLVLLLVATLFAATLPKP